MLLAGSGALAMGLVEVLRRQRALKQALEFQQRLIAIVGHDLRSPLTTMLTGADLLLRQPDLDPSVRKTAERIRRSGSRIEGLTSLLIDFTRARVGSKIPVRFQSVDLHEVVGNVLDECRGHAQREITHTREGEGHARVDPERIAQILTNLVQNAIRYGRPDTPIHVVSRGDCDEVCFSVRNYGPVIPKELRTRIFDPFQRGSQDEATLRLSLGLGLYIVQELVRAHQGSIQLSSEVEDGTCFYVTLPRGLPLAKEPVASEQRSLPTLH